MPSESVFSPQDPHQTPNSSLFYPQVCLKSEEGKLGLILPTVDYDNPKEELEAWAQTLQEIKSCLKNSDRSWQKGTGVHLIAGDRLLDGRQLQGVSDALHEADLQLTCVRTDRRQTAVAAATSGYSVEQHSLTQAFGASQSAAPSPLAEPLYLKTTVRSGMEIRHPGTIIILGDINPGGEAIADGDIIVWGGLRGIAHAGAKGNREGRIMALWMKPTQLRIADVVARVSEPPPEQVEPEVAYLSPEGIRLSPAIDFAKTYRFVREVGGWLDEYRRK